MEKKKFKLSSAILSVICVVFVAEAAAPVAAIGNSQYFWWIFMIVAFLLPYGLISAELGTSYTSDGGLVDWITQAYGRKWGSRAAWYYWINFPLWMASLAVMVPDLISMITGIELGLVPGVLIQLAFVWIVVWISFYPVCDSIWILNGAAAIKVLLAVAIGCLGIYGMTQNGLANPFTFTDLLPSFDIDSLSLISVIIFNMLGFEVICTFADDMENPSKQIPQAIIIGGIAIAAIYLFSAFGISAAIPFEEIGMASGLTDAFIILLNTETGPFIILVAFLFLLTLFGNMISWSLGVNNTACYAAEQGALPAVFAKRSAKNDMPIGSAIMNGIVATVIVILGIFLGESDLFWAFFALNLVSFLSSYIMMFPSFLKLRKEDPETPRVFKVPGNETVLKILAYVPMALIIISIIFTAVPLSFDPETLAATLPITIGTVAFLIVGEIIIAVKKIKD